MKKHTPKKYSFIFERTMTVAPSDIQILEESKTNSGKPKLAFSSRLQEADVINNNKRKYSMPVCESIVTGLTPKAQSRSLFMEIDHPMFSAAGSDPNTLKRRAAIVELNNCGAVIRKIDFKDGQIIGEIETLSGFKGPDLANLISKDKVNIGFSLRALGGVEPLSDGTLMVKQPIMPITYDVVSNPSHSNARIMEFLPENDMSILESAESIICENEEFGLLDEDHITVCEGNVCVKRFIDDVMAEHFMAAISSPITFKL